jgi:hypothetical protein
LHRRGSKVISRIFFLLGGGSRGSWVSVRGEVKLVSKQKRKEVGGQGVRGADGIRIYQFIKGPGSMAGGPDHDELRSSKSICEGSKVVGQDSIPDGQ